MPDPIPTNRHEGRSTDTFNSNGAAQRDEKMAKLMADIGTDNVGDTYQALAYGPPWMREEFLRRLAAAIGLRNDLEPVWQERDQVEAEAEAAAQKDQEAAGKKPMTIVVIATLPKDLLDALGIELSD